MRIFTLILLIIITGKLSATPELEYLSYEEKNITIDVIYRYKNSIKRLYFESLTKNLDKYIKDLKAQGKLDRGKIHFEIMTGEWMDKSIGIEMYRYKNGYYCRLNGLIQPITQEYLTKIITYFSYDSWESFCYNDSLVSPKVALNIFNRRVDSIQLTNNFESRKLIDLNYVALYYQNDTLICKDSNQEYGQISFLLPFSHNKLDFVTNDKTIFVIGESGVINMIDLSYEEFTGSNYDQPWVEIFPKWINFKNFSGYFLSYSMDENKFYKL
jgi:hypothetical protein